MKEDRSLSEEQRKAAREAITRDEVEKGKSADLENVCFDFVARFGLYGANDFYFSAPVER